MGILVTIWQTVLSQVAASPISAIGPCIVLGYIRDAFRGLDRPRSYETVATAHIRVWVLLRLFCFTISPLIGLWNPNLRVRTFIRNFRLHLLCSFLCSRFIGRELALVARSTRHWWVDNQRLRGAAIAGDSISLIGRWIVCVLSLLQRRSSTAVQN
jgi:hypothetical protein